jgi:hypothetical protein
MSDDDSNALLQLHRALGEVVAEIADSDGIEPAGRGLADFAVQHLGADIAAVSRHPRRGGPELVASTDEAVGELVAARERYPHLPGATPLAEGEILVVAESHGQGPQGWHPIAAQLGLRTALMVGLPPLSRGPATLELYSYGPAAFTATMSEIARLAKLAGSALRVVERRTDLEDALQSRDVIGCAQGILMERYRLTGDQAMAYLRRHSQQSQEPIRQLAAAVVGRRESESRAAQLGSDPE